MFVLYNIYIYIYILEIGNKTTLSSRQACFVIAHSSRDLHIYIYFEKQVKRIMSETNNGRVFEDERRYRVWSLTGQGYLNLKLIPKNGAQPSISVECSGTGNELSSTEIFNNCCSLGVQFPLIGVAIRSFCWLLIRYLKPFLFVFWFPFQISNSPATCSVLSLSGRTRERRSVTLCSGIK